MILCYDAKISIFQALPDCGRLSEEMEKSMGMNIFIGILCVLALGGSVWAWWIGRGDSSEKKNQSDKSEDRKQ